MQLITVENKKHPLYILWRSGGLWILENTVLLSGILWWLRPRVSINRNSWLFWNFEIHIQDLHYFLQDPGEDALLHTSSQTSMDIPGSVAQWITSPVGSGEQTLLDVQPAQKHGTLQIPWRGDSQVCSPEGLWREKAEKMTQIALLKMVLNMICLGADHRITDYFGLKGALKTI